MKYVDNPKLAYLSSYLTEKEVGDAVLFGRLESLVCKAAPTEREQTQQLEAQYKQELASAAKPVQKSSLGSMEDAATRKLLINLIMTMNATFPDYDFSGLRAENFVVEHSVDQAITTINAALAELVALHEPDFLSKLYATIDEEISLRDAIAISYVVDSTEDPLAEEALWSFNYFFYNRSTRKILYFYCTAKSKFRYYASREPTAPTPASSQSADLAVPVATAPSTPAPIAPQGLAVDQEALRRSGQRSVSMAMEEEDDDDDEEADADSEGTASTGSQGNVWDDDEMF